jgi:hypothetical protein
MNNSLHHKTSIYATAITAIFTGLLITLGLPKSLVTYAQSNSPLRASRLVVTSVSPPLLRPISMQPQPFLIYYGWFSQNSTVLAQQARAMEKYSVVVIGSGLENAVNPDFNAARTVIGEDSATAFYGYISIGKASGLPNYSRAAIAQRAKEWAAIGVKGILLDDAGPDFGVSQGRLQSVISMVHALHLHVIVNSWDPAAVIDVGLAPGDGYLAENWAIAAGKVSTPPVEARALAEIKQQHIAVYMTATNAQAPTTPQAVIHDARATLSLVEGNYMAVAGPNYSSTSNRIVPERWVASGLAPASDFGHQNDMRYVVPQK